MKVLVVPDKFRGTLEPNEFVLIIRERFAYEYAISTVAISDGGDGLLESLDVSKITVDVHDALMRPITAPFGLAKNGDAVVEMSRASGLDVIGGAEYNDPINATTFGTGELIKAAIESGAKRVVVGCGGSATTDGGIGALEAINGLGFETDLLALSDVKATYLEAARTFAPQKGATKTQVLFLEARLVLAAQTLERAFGRNPIGVIGSGAAGGLAGLIFAMGGKIVSGFDYVADVLDLKQEVVNCDLIITGEGKLDIQSFNGKVVGQLVQLAIQHQKRILVICGSYDVDVVSRYVSPTIKFVSLTEHFGESLARAKTKLCLQKILNDPAINEWIGNCGN